MLYCDAQTGFRQTPFLSSLSKTGYEGGEAVRCAVSAPASSFGMSLGELLDFESSGNGGLGLSGPELTGSMINVKTSKQHSSEAVEVLNPSLNLPYFNFIVIS